MIYLADAFIYYAVCRSHIFLVVITVKSLSIAHIYRMLMQMCMLMVDAYKMSEHISYTGV